ncbi:U32 family peptidase [Marinilabiliaceae bacterium ANBcel2]|nr:U32 family peptidase [Marinilabiliaceae bacterium ANBcel2]
MERSDFEIMAPAGSFDSLIAAVQGGADSVYFGAGSLNMRSRSSSNFSLDDLKEISKICYDNGLKSYLTLNTVLYDDDLSEMRQMIELARETGISAVIASDQSAITYAREKGVSVHLSTQVNISNSEALKFYSDFADVVVLARELNVNQVKKIYNTIVDEDIRGPGGELIRIEMFCHGALCMAVSGKCYLSLHQFNKSANRGACYQTCRRGYYVTDRDSGYELEVDNKYIMSPKDLKTIHFINKMIDAGVSIFKIEGRARGPEYVRKVTQCYNEAIESVIEDTFTSKKIDNWDSRLVSVFNRGFWDGYYLGQKLGEWSKEYGSQATQKKLYLGKGMNYFPKIGIGEFLLETNTLNVGDKVLLTGPTTGAVEFTVKELRVDLKPVKRVEKGERFSMPVDAKVRRADKLFKIVHKQKDN